ncbi:MULTISPECIES: DUF4307 domain-containing protein [Arthrobacter]|uniref:DUF4307 domain-containing protein n=1 Tax=unclassified Arthrobacter TaxID=235627 RepID=UPI0024B916ED|nr:DUF4307 domain-containing protein [Arthrobacter sp. H35-MC1]MDJ0317224.1 DUF4307 domain-containing protein [Arthrobacter sp. H35-MC1]
MTTSDSPAATSLTNRYGTPKRSLSKKNQKILLAVAAVLSLSWVLWVIVGGNTGVSQKILSYNVVDATMTTVDLSVTKTPDATAECAIKAMNESFAVVGWNVITIGPNAKDVGSENGRTTTVRGELRTDSLAVTGVVENCWIVKPM